MKHEECSVRYPNAERWVEKTWRNQVFLTNFSVFDVASQGIDNSWTNFKAKVHQVL